MATQHGATKGFWGRATRALGRLWQGVIQLPDRPADDRRAKPFDIARFPPF